MILSFTCGDFDIGLSDLLRGICLPGSRQWAAIEVLLLPLMEKTVHPVLNSHLSQFEAQGEYNLDGRFVEKSLNYQMRAIK
jgi:hypothetical protein